MAKNRRRRQKKNRLRQRNNGPAPQSYTLPLPVPLERQSGNDTKSEVSDKKDHPQQQGWSVRKLWASSKKVIVTMVGLLGVGGASWLLSGADLFYQSRQAKFAEEQVGVARQQLSSDERTVVSLTEPIIDLDSGMASIGLQAAGRRPAQKVRGEVTEMRLILAPKKDGTVFPVTIGTHKEMINMGGIVVAPTAAPTYIPILLHRYDRAEKAQIENGTEMLSLSGEITYDDGTGETQTLGVCQIYHHSSSKPWWETCGWAKGTGNPEEDWKKAVEMNPFPRDLYPPR